MNSAKIKLKELVGMLIRYTGIASFINQTIKRKVTILLYHDPSVEILDSHLKYLKKYFVFISLDTLVDAIYSKSWDSIPDNALIITIDDGFKDNYKLLKLCDQYGFRPTIFICSHIVNTNKKFWFKQNGIDPHLYFKYENSEMLALLFKKYGYTLDKEYTSRQALNLDEIKKMEPFIDFQSHTKYHPLLTRCIGQESSKEINESKKKLSDMLKKDVKHFCYPVGDYSDETVIQVKEAGYRSARTCDIGWNHSNTDPFLMKSMAIEDDASVNVMITQLYGIAGYLRFAMKGSFNGKAPKII
ncbi:MAG: polysaccharide deacetylase family protein [Desulfobacteraceae bacterium]|nr:polysaccharide deacetylase family protein [Desulfobacteraceae bacterium]